MTGRMVRVVYFLKYGLRSGHVALAAFHGLADGNGGDRHALAHLPPLRHLEGERDLRVALGDLDRPGLERARNALRAEAALSSEPHSASRDGLAHGVERQEAGAILARAPRIRASVWSSL